MMKPKTTEQEMTAQEIRYRGFGERRGWLADVADICNSELAQGIATALVILAVLLGVGGCCYLVQKDNSEVNKATAKE